MQLNHDRRGSGEPVVLIHGVGSHWLVWEPVLDKLARQRDVTSIDMPGHGESPTLPIGTAPTARALAEAVASFIDELGLERPLVGGNSLGGWVGLELAKLGRARAVVGFSPAGFWTRAEARWCEQSLGNGLRIARSGARPLVERSIRTTFGRRIALWNLIARPERISHEAAIDIQRNGAASPGFAPTLAVTTADRFSGGGDVQVPVTVAWGTKDRLLFPRQAKRALAELPDARYVAIPGAGHLPMLDDPDAVVRELLAA